jgi:hypothetical protein
LYDLDPINELCSSLFEPVGGAELEQPLSKQNKPNITTKPLGPTRRHAGKDRVISGPIAVKTFTTISGLAFTIAGRR